MADANKTVFLSYRRNVSWPLAEAVRADLVAHGFDVFMDVGSIDSGEFEPVIMREIEQRAHFLVLLEPHSLDSVAEANDWLRREIAHALSSRRNVVPLLVNGARMPHAGDLPADIARLPSFNAVSVPPDYFTEAMQKLRDRFLRVAECRSPPPAATLRDESVPEGRPRATSPLDLEVASFGDVGVVLRWGASSGAVRYVVEVTRGGLTSVIYRGPALVLHDLSSRSGAYRVRAEYQDGAVGQWSALARWPEPEPEPHAPRRPWWRR